MSPCSAARRRGLEAIVNLICAADAPDSGKIVRTHSIASWPIPSSNFVSQHLPLIANARFIARLYEADEGPFLARLDELGRFGDWFTERVEDCPQEVRSLFCFLAGSACPSTNTSSPAMNVGAKSERDRIGEMIDELRQRAGLLLIGQDVKAAQQYCTQAYVFDKAEATYYDDMEAAAEAFQFDRGERRRGRFPGHRFRPGKPGQCGLRSCLIRPRNA